MQIASASTTVKFHEFPSGTVLHNYQPGTTTGGPIRSISWSKDGKWLALVPHIGQPEIVSIKDQLKLIHTIQGIADPTCATFQNTTKKNIAIGTLSGAVLLYDIKARVVRKTYANPGHAISHLEFNPKDSHLVAACGDGSALVYSNVSNNLVGTLAVPRSQSISALRTHPMKRNLAAAGSKEGVVAVWDINTNKTRFYVGAHKAPISAVAFSTINAELVVSAGLDRQFCFFDLGSSKCIASCFVESNILALDFAPDGRFVSMAAQNGDIHVYDMKNFNRPMYTHPAHNSGIRHLLYRKMETSCGDASGDSSFPDLAKPAEAVGEDVSGSNQSVSALFSPGGAGEALPEAQAQDSFMAALGMEEESATSAASTVKSVDATKTVETATPISSNASKQLLEPKLGKRLTSTPNLNQLMTSQVGCGGHFGSPIVRDDGLRGLVKEEMKVVVEEVKEQLRQVRKQSQDYFLDLVMHNVKESIKMENQFNALRAQMPQFARESFEAVLDENFALKQRVAALEAELAMTANERHSF